MKGHVALLLLLAATTAQAKDQVMPLSEADATALSGKTVAVTLHERPSFTAMTAGKAGFGLFGVGAMVSAGNKLVDENHVEDPAVLIRSQLASSLASAYGAQMQPVDTTPTASKKKPKEIAAAHPQADYVLDVESAGWMYSYRPTQWDIYWVSYSVQVKLVTKDGRLASNLACSGHTQAHPASPSRDELHANGAALLKQVTASLGWNCVQLLARQQFRIPDDKIAATPAEFADPLTARKAKPASAVAAAPAAAPAAPVATEAAPAAP